MKSQKIIILSLLILLISILVPISFVLAGPLQAPDKIIGSGSYLQQFNAGAGINGSETLGQITSTIIKAFLGLLGIIFIILIILAGYNWMTAGGEEAKVTKAKDTIVKAIIGLLIIISAYAITYFVFNAVPFGGSSFTTDGTMPVN